MGSKAPHPAARVFARTHTARAAAQPSAAQVHSAFRLPLIDLLATHKALLRVIGLARRAVAHQRWRALVSALLLRAEQPPASSPSSAWTVPADSPSREQRPQSTPPAQQMRPVGSPEQGGPVASTPRRRLRVLGAERLARVDQSRLSCSATGPGVGRGGRRRRRTERVPGARAGGGLEQRLSAAYHVAIVRGLRR